MQIYQEAKKFGKVFNIKVVCAYGGGSMWEQTKACQEGAEIIVATPVSISHECNKVYQDSRLGQNKLFMFIFAVGEGIFN